MRTPTDALRSFKRYIAASLGAEWEVRLTGEEGAFRRPYAHVGTATAATTSGGAATPVVTQTFEVVCHPKEQTSAIAARLEAARVEELLWQAFNVGTHRAAFVEMPAPDPAMVLLRGHPRRIPLYDYDGVGIAEAVEEDARNPRDFMRAVEDPSVEVLVGDDELILVVVANIRMSWSRSAAVLSAGMTVESVRTTPEEKDD